MRIKDAIAEEIKNEKKLFEELEKQCRKFPLKVLKVTKSRKGYESFYYRERPGGRMKYISAADKKMLRKITYGKFLSEKKKVISENIKGLEKAMEIIKNYDTESVTESLPAVYRRAIAHLDGKMAGETGINVIQSENPNHPENLRVICSNGLRVRSKNEMAICELLSYYGLDYRYEMALELSKITLRDDGTAIMESVTLYPDFTIFLPDGEVVYWEHFGMLDKEDYRSGFANKMILYYDNGIYPPRNLIITMDGPGKEFDGLGMRRIIEERILPML